MVVGDPVAILPAVIEIEHGCHRVYAQAVNMVLIQPEHRAGNQEACHLVAPIVKYTGAPLAVLALARVGILIAGGAVELIKAVGILGEMRWYPVENHADPGLMALIDEIHKIMRCAIAGGYGKITSYLIPPGAVERMLHHRHKLHMGIPHFGEIGNQLLRKLAIVEKVLIGIPLPGAGVDLIDIDRPVIDHSAAFRLFPSLVAPFVAAQLIDL